MNPKLEQMLDEEYEEVSIDEVLDIADKEYVDVELEEYDEEDELNERTGLQLWNRGGYQQKRMTLDRETLKEHFGDADYEMY